MSGKLGDYVLADLLKIALASGKQSFVRLVLSTGAELKFSQVASLIGNDSSMLNFVVDFYK